MGRNDRNRKKKSDRSTFFIMPLILAVLLGLGASLFSLKFIKKTYNFDLLTTKINETGEPNRPSQKSATQDTQPVSGIARIASPADIKTGTLKDFDFVPKTGLPNLLDSDTLIRKQLIKLSPAIAPWLNTDQIIRRYLMIVNDFSQGTRVAKHMSFLRLEEPFSVMGDGSVLYISPKSFRRYNNLAQTLQTIDAGSAVKFYLAIRPLVLQVFGEFGYPRDITLESIIKKAAGEIIAAPVIEGDIELVRPSLFYKYADANLEALNPVQKQLIRMGPENVKIFQQKCREFLVELAKNTS